MRLYSRSGASALDHADYGHFEADEAGAFDLPDDLAEHLHRFHVGGSPLWEDEIERQRRLVSEELERRKDPATLLAAVEALVKAAATAGVPAVPAEPDPEVTEAAAAQESDVVDEPSAAVVRAWAKDHDIDVPARGRIPQEVVDAYKSADH